MWIESIRIRLPLRRPADVGFGDRNQSRAASLRRRTWSRQAAAEHAADERLIAAIFAGLVARELLAPSDGPADRLRRRVGYVVRDALAVWRREAADA